MSFYAEFLERKDVQMLLQRCHEQSKVVQGVIIEIDPLWLLLWSLAERMDPQIPIRGFSKFLPELEWIFERFISPWPFHPPPDVSRFLIRFMELSGVPLLRNGMEWLNLRPRRSVTSRDLSWMPPGHHWGVGQDDSNLIVRICLRPGQQEGISLPEGSGKELGYRVIQEERPVAWLCAGNKTSLRPLRGGVSLGSGSWDPGTLGGILEDGRGGFYALTCAHVVDPSATSANTVEQPAQADGGTVKDCIGTVIHSVMPPAFPPGLAPTRPNQAQHSGKVDASLISLSQTPGSGVLQIGRPSGIMSLDDTFQGQTLKMTGRSSGWHPLECGNRSPYYNLRHTTTGQEHCYEDLLVLRDTAGAQPVQPGDSGSWICADDPVRGLSWVGVAVGGDSQMGFATAAAHVRDWWQNQGLQLQIA